MPMSIDKRLNLVIPVEREDVGDTPGTTLYVHSTPIMYETWKAYWGVLSRVFSRLLTSGVGTTSGPKIAALMLEEEAKNLGVWEGEDGVQNGLVREVHRLSNVLLPIDGGWKTVQYEDALRTGKFTRDEAEEVEGQITFFIVVSAAAPRAQLKSILGGLTYLWNAQPTLLNCTEYSASLRTSSETASSGETPTTSLPVSSIGPLARVG